VRRKLLSISLLLLLVTALVSACSSGSSGGGGTADRLAAIKKRGTLLVGMGVYVPESYFDANNNWVGYDAQIFQGICKALGVECVAVSIPLAGIGPALANGTIDSYIGLYKTPEREKFAAYTNLVESTTEVIAATSESGINSISDIQGKTLGSVRGSGELTELQALVKDYPAKISIYDTGDVMLQDLIKGRIQAVIWPSDLIDYAIKTDPSFKDIKDVAALPEKYLPGGAAATQLYFIAPKGQEGASLLAAMNKAIDGMTSSGEIAKILQPFGLVPPSSSG
jgi:ABC-type amino acid transport substrate-binding protein